MEIRPWLTTSKEGLKTINIFLETTKNGLKPSNLTLETRLQYKWVLYNPKMIVVLGLSKGDVLKIWENPCLEIRPSLTTIRRSGNT